MKLTNLEKETIILFNEAETTASIQVHSSRLRRRLDQLHAERPEEVSLDHNGDFVIPKGWIKVNPKRIISEKERQRLAKQLKS